MEAPSNSIHINNIDGMNTVTFCSTAVHLAINNRDLDIQYWRRPDGPDWEWLKNLTKDLYGEEFSQLKMCRVFEKQKTIEFSNGSTISANIKGVDIGYKRDLQIELERPPVDTTSYYKEPEKQSIGKEIS